MARSTIQNQFYNYYHNNTHVYALTPDFQNAFTNEGIQMLCGVRPSGLDPSKCLQLFMMLHGVTSHKNLVFSTADVTATNLARL
jgi:hypothetical protein